MSKEPTYIDLKEFARRIDVGIGRAREMSRCKLFRDQHISVNVNPDGKQGGIRIHWNKYLEFLNENPVVPESKLYRPKLKVI